MFASFTGDSSYVSGYCAVCNLDWAYVFHWFIQTTARSVFHTFCKNIHKAVTLVRGFCSLKRSCQLWGLNSMLRCKYLGNLFSPLCKVTRQTNACSKLIVKVTGEYKYFGSLLPPSSTFSTSHTITVERRYCWKIYKITLEIWLRSQMWGLGKYCGNLLP